MLKTIFLPKEMINDQLNTWYGGGRMLIISVAFAIVALVVGLIAGYIVRKSTHEKELAGARNTATGILEEARREAETMKK